MTEPQEPDPDLDTLTRAQLHELDGPAGVVADVLDDVLFRHHGITSSAHHAGLFLDLLAGAEPVGYRVTPIDPGPPIEQLLAPDKVPARLLEQIAAAWPNRRPVSAVNALYAAQTQYDAAPLPGIVEQALVDELTRGLQREGHQLLTTTGPVWTRYPATAGTHAELVTDPPLKRQPQELPWKPGDPASGHDVLLCRITGTSVPTLIEETPA